TDSRFGKTLFVTSLDIAAAARFHRASFLGHSFAQTPVRLANSWDSSSQETRGSRSAVPVIGPLVGTAFRNMTAGAFCCLVWF
ncbi:MAG TPA: hypothetical protein VKP30_06030, partial [Polyangiaceae bacterium]|nr:hypothetical protein [Polyangiaceae bacterium]